MKALAKEQRRRVEEVAERLRTARTALDNEIEIYNAALNKAWTDLNAKLETYNEAARDAKELAEEVHSDLENFHDERSEKWQESDAGSAFRSWVEEWGNASFDDADRDEPVELDLDQEDYAEALESLPQEVPS